MEVNLTTGSCTVRLGGVASYCESIGGWMVQPDSPAGVELISITFSRPGTSWQAINQVPVNDNVPITSTVATGTTMQPLDAMVVGFTWTTRPPNPTSPGNPPFSANDEIMAINVVAYGPLTGLGNVLIRPTAIGHPSNPVVAALRTNQLVYDNATIASIPSVIDLDAVAAELPTGAWGSFGNPRPDIDDYIGWFGGFCGELWKGWGSASYTPSQQHPGYGAAMASLTGEGLMLVVSTEDTAKRRELARRMTQWGIDLMGAFASGRSDIADGGHYQGRKALIVLALHLLETGQSANTLFPGQFNEDVQFHTASPAWVWGWPYGYRGKSDAALPINIADPIASWNATTLYYLPQYFQQEVCGTQVSTAVAMNILGLRSEMGVAHYGMMAQFMEGPSPADLAAMEARSASLATIDWGKSYSLAGAHGSEGAWNFGDAAWTLYGDYEPPATTVVIYDHSAHPSVRYTATVNGEPLPLCGRTTDAHFSTPYWFAGQMVDQSWATVATNGDVEIVVALISGPITTAKVYTRHPSLGKLIPSTISGGLLSFTLPYDSAAWCEIDGVRGQPLIIHSKPIIEQPTGPTVDIYDGSQTSATAGRTLVFPPGTHTIGQSFEVPAGAKIWLHGEAWVIGSIYAPSAVGGHEPGGGHGVLSGEWGASLRSYIRTLPYEEAIEYCLVRGTFGVLADSKLWGITLVDPPFYTMLHGANLNERLTLIAPWWGNANGFFIAQKSPEQTASVTKCVAFAHDDIFDMGEYYGAHRFSDNIVGCIASASFLISYWPNIDVSGDVHVAERNTIVCLNYAIENGGSIVLGWCDGSDPEEVVDGVVIDGADFVGSTINGRPFDLRHKQYPIEWGPLQELRMGQIQNITFRNITFEVVPTFKSKIEGRDANNRTRNVVFENVWYASTRLTAGNFRDYFDIDEFATNITVDGVRVDMIQTTGAATVAVGASGTSGLQIVSVGGASVSISAAGAAALQVGAVGTVTIPIGASGFSTLGVVVPVTPPVPTNEPRGPGVTPSARLRRRRWWTWLNPW